MQLFIVRHGDPFYPRDTLTEKGMREAELLSERLTKLGIEQFYVSPLGRARDTAAPTLKKLGAKPVILDWLQEFPVYGIDPNTGKKHIIWDYYPSYFVQHPLLYDRDKWMDDDTFSGKEVRPLINDVWGRLDALLAKYGYVREGDLYRVTDDARREARLALVCHMGIGLILLSHLTNISSQALLHGVFLAPSSVTHVITEEREKGFAHFRCAAIGDISHLYAHGEPFSPSGFFQEFYKD